MKWVIRLKKISIVSILFFSIAVSIIQGVAKGEEIGNTSTVGNLAVNSSEKEEIIMMLTKKIEQWKEQPIVLKSTQEEIHLNPDAFIFDVTASVETYIEATSGSWFEFWKEDVDVHLPIIVEIDESLLNILNDYPLLDVSSTLVNVKNHAEYLMEGPIEAIEQDYSILEEERLAFTVLQANSYMLGETKILDLLNDIVIPKGQTFSFIDSLKSEGIMNNEAMDFVASVLYATVLKTDLELLERHSQGIIPNYLEAGIEVDIEINQGKDFKFKNSSDSPVVLKMGMQGTELLVEFYTSYSDLKGEYEVLDKETVTPRTIYRYSNSLKPGEEKLIQEGEPGRRVTVYRTISDKKGPYEKQEVISKDYYPPVHRIVMISKTVANQPTSDSDTELDLNGDGLPDMNPGNTNEHEELPNQVEDFEGEEEEVLYDKAGNIITP